MGVQRGWQEPLPITLDQIISSSFFYLEKWSPNTINLKSNAAFDVLRYLLCRLYEEGNGKPLQAHVELSHSTIGSRLGLSRPWVCEMVGRLVDGGWLVATSTWVGDNMRSSSCFSAGRQLRRLICYLLGSKRKKRHSKGVNGRLQSGPLQSSTKEKKEDFAFQKAAEETIDRLSDLGNRFANWGKRMQDRAKTGCT